MLLINQNSPVTTDYLEELLKVGGWTHNTRVIDAGCIDLEEDEDGSIVFAWTVMSVVSINNLIKVIRPDGSESSLELEIFSRVEVNNDGDEIIDQDDLLNNIEIRPSLIFCDDSGARIELNESVGLIYPGEFENPDLKYFWDALAELRKPKSKKRLKR